MASVQKKLETSKLKLEKSQDKLEKENIEASEFQIQTLVNNGIQKVKDFQKKAGEAVASLPGIGRKLAKSIFEKITKPIF